MKITKQDILELVTDRVYQRGVAYYNQGRVQLLTQDEDSFTALVRGSRNYQVLVDYNDEDDCFDADCTCPYWDVCKHVVAAMLAAQKAYEATPVAGKRQGEGHWNKFFREIDGGPKIVLPNKQKYQLLFLFQVTMSGWHLMPKKQTIKQDGSLGALQNIGFGDFFNINIKRSKSDDLVLSLLDKWKNSQPFYTYNYDWPGAYGYKFGDKLGVVFHLLRETRSLYFSDAGKCGNPVLFSQTKGKIEFRLEETENSFIFNPYLVLNGQEVVLDHGFKVLTSDPVWLLQDDILIETDDFEPAKSLIPFTQSNGKVTIPKEDFPQFLTALMAQSELVDYFQLPAGIRKENCESISENRLYIVEHSEGLQINLKFAYGLAEIGYNDTRTTFWASNTEGNVLYKVTRNSQLEQQAYHLLLDTRVKVLRGNEIVTRKNKELQWLIEDVPELLNSGFVIFGEENLQKYKINRAAPRVSVSVESGIDWFDLDMEIDVGGVLLSLQELKRAIKKKSSFVRLADGSLATLPKSWLDRFRHTLNLAKLDGKKLKFSSFHVTLIDELFAEAAQKEFDKPYKDRLKKLQNFKGIKKVKPPVKLANVLRPYQISGYQWLNFLKEYDFGGCLADDMGLGKTVQALTLLQSIYKNGCKEPSLIVCPTSVIFNWLDEITRFTPQLRVLNQTGNDRNRTTDIYKNYDIILTSYGTLRRDVVFLKDVLFNYVILDESQNIKNPVSLTAKAARLLNAKHRLALTGTPIENNTIELWSLFSFLNPGLLGNLTYFKSAFAKPIEQQKDQPTAEILRKLIFPFLLRRTKDAVAVELPPKVENIVYCEMSASHQKVYNQWRDYYRAAILKQISDVGLTKSRMNVLEGLVKLRQVACHPLLVEKWFQDKVGKYDKLLEYFEELSAEGHKVLLFSQFVRMLTIIRKYLDSAGFSYEYLDGKTRNRKKCVERFQTDDDCKIFLISLKAGGTGINLTAADYVIHYDPWWNPAVEAQATDRSHRIGQDKHVFVYKMITKDTVEEKILQLQERKKELVSNIITTGTGLFKQLTLTDIEELFS